MVSDYILFLRGINLGKRNKVPMAELKACLHDYGFNHVETYLQTGNVWVKSKEPINTIELEQTLEERFGFSIPILVRTRDELLEIGQHPLFNNDNVFVLFLKDASHYPLIKDKIKEDHELINNNLIVYYSTSYHQTTFNNNWFERQLKTDSTLRNKNTILKVVDRFHD